MGEIIDGWNKKYESKTKYEAAGNGVISNYPARPVIGYDNVQFSNGVSGDITFNGLWGSARFEPRLRVGENGRQEMYINGRWEDVHNYYV